MKIQRFSVAALLIFFSAIFIFTGCEINNNTERVSVLILSGKGNHAWDKTTPLLKRIFNLSGLFTVESTDMPDTLNLEAFNRYDAVISNFNTWPDNEIRFSPEWEKDFLAYVENGGGAVFIHAGASSFYK